MNYTDKLVREYQEIFRIEENRPEWAVKKKKNPSEIVHPPVPFVGKHYDRTKVLLYASAENLTYYTEENKPLDYLDDDNIAIDRHRHCFERYSTGRNFPFVHISPIEDGSLIITASYIIYKLKDILYDDPFKLIESISLGNFGKFSIDTIGKNRDYASKLSFLKYSIPYISVDLSILKPDIIIIPVTTYKNKKIKNTIHSILPNVSIVPIYQINAGNINRHIRPKFKPKEVDQVKEFYRLQKNLTNGITGKTNDNFLSVYTYIDEVLKNIK